MSTDLLGTKLAQQSVLSPTRPYAQHLGLGGVRNIHQFLVPPPLHYSTSAGTEQDAVITHLRHNNHGQIYSYFKNVGPARITRVANQKVQIKEFHCLDGVIIAF